MQQVEFQFEFVLLLKKKIFKFHSIVDFHHYPLEVIKFWLTHIYKSKVKIWTICGQLRLEVNSEFLKQASAEHLIFMNFGAKNFAQENDLRHKMFHAQTL
jgi:hypothetical protein